MKTIFLLLFGSISTILCTEKGTNNILASLCKYFHCCCSDSLWPHRMQHTRLPCPSLSPGACSKSRPLSRWCHPTISSSVIPFSSCLQFCPTSRCFPVSWLFTSGGLSIGASASVCPMNIQGWFPLGLTGLISLLSKGLSRVFSSITVRKHSAFLMVQLAHPYMTTKWCLCFLICCLGLSQLFFQGVCLLILWLQSPSSVILVSDLINFLKLLPGLLYVHR